MSGQKHTGQAWHRHGHGRLMQGKPGTGMSIGGSCRAGHAQAWEAHAGHARHRYGHGRLMQGRSGTGMSMGGSCRASYVRDGQGRLRIGIEENVGDAVVQILGTDSGFCFGPDLRIQGQKRGRYQKNDRELMGRAELGCCQGEPARKEYSGRDCRGCRPSGRRSGTGLLAGRGIFAVIPARKQRARLRGSAHRYLAELRQCSCPCFQAERQV